ncbi:MAG: enoyl-CoA hydratase/isomerase family protein [Actinomycetota bacterium]|nr:enoyl-CoA hydratase/isomerase family protein [Actinomycetota bacterium]
MAEVILERQGAATILTIDRPSAHNAISRSVMDELDAALTEVAGSDTRVLAIRGAGERVFVSGGDLKDLASVRTEAGAQAMALRMRDLLDRVAGLPVPVLGALNGHALGGGGEVAIACDFRIAADDVRLAFNQVELAITPAWGGIERLEAVVGRARALYLLSTGLPIDATTAAAWGLVEEVVPRADFERRLFAVLERIGRAPRAALVGIKATVETARPTVRPELAAAATASFARVWVDDAHWEAVAEMERRRAAARSRPAEPPATPPEAG